MIVPPVKTLAIMCVWATHCSTTSIEVEVFIPEIQICPETTREGVPKFAVCPDTTIKDVSQSSVCLDTTTDSLFSQIRPRGSSPNFLSALIQLERFFPNFLFALVSRPWRPILHGPLSYLHRQCHPGGYPSCRHRPSHLLPTGHPVQHQDMDSIRREVTPSGRVGGVLSQS